MAGGFARYTQNEKLWWAFDVFADIQPGDDLYLPYVGAVWSYNDQWTFNVIMPWPAIVYSPSQDVAFRLGAVPSGASWQVTNRNEEDVTYNLDSWDFGVSAERRFQGKFWAVLEAGVGGLRGLRVSSGNIEGPDIDISASTFISFSINYRPTLRRPD